METIAAGEEKVCRLLGKQSMKASDTQYRCIKYLLRTECSKGVLLHNVITGQLVLLNKAETEAVDCFSIMANSTVRDLIENYFLVPVEFDEKALVKKLRIMINRLFKADGIHLFTILTTTNCNAKCFYCYEKKLSRIDMDEKTAHNVVEYVLTHKIPGKIKLNWFGGEPLVCYQRIDQICSELHSRGVEYSSSMTSNGYLFESDMVKKAVELWKLEEIQITLDGTKDTYNRVKAYAEDDDNPFERVMNNIELLLQSGVRVSIRLNFDRYNIGDIKTLIGELKERFGQYQGMAVYDHFILQKPGITSVLRSRAEEDQLLREQIIIEQQLIDLGMRKNSFSLPWIRGRSCGADKEDAIVIYPDGRLYECIEIAEEDQVGDIQSAQFNELIMKEYQNTDELEECTDCPLYPFCVILKKCPDTVKSNRINCEYKILKSISSIKAHAHRTLALHDNG